MIIGFIIIALLIIALVWYVSTLNSLKVMTVKIDEAESGIDVALAKRYDVLKKMLDACKGYMKHERETLFDVINLRQGMTMGEKAQANSQMDEVQRQISFTAEAYPELRSSDTFVMLQKSILDVEEHLQAARRAYNAAVSAYNQKILVFPSSIVANAGNFTKRDFFEARAAQREDVKIDFN